MESASWQSLIVNAPLEWDITVNLPNLVIEWFLASVLHLEEQKLAAGVHIYISNFQFSCMDHRRVNGCTLRKFRMITPRFKAVKAFIDNGIPLEVNDSDSQYVRWLFFTYTQKREWCNNRMIDIEPIHRHKRWYWKKTETQLENKFTCTCK